MRTYYYTGKIKLRSGSTECYATYANASVSVSPEYVTHRNIMYNEINILKGYRLSIEIEMLFNRAGEDDNQIDSLINILNAISANINGINGLNQDISVLFYDRVLSANVKEFTFNRLDSNIQLTDYISNNMNLGQIFKIKMSQGNLLPSIPLWISDENIYNDVLHDVDYTVAIDF